MGLLNIGTLFLTFVTLLTFIELSYSQEKGSPSGPPPPAPQRPPPPPPRRVRPPSYVIENGVVRLTGPSIGGIIGVIDGYFLGTVENHVYHPVDPDDEQEVILLRTGRFVRVDQEFRRQLQNGFYSQILREHQERRRGRGPRGATSAT